MSNAEPTGLLPFVPSGADFAASRALLADYDRCDDDALARIAAVGRQTRGRRDKYRPPT